MGVYYRKRSLNKHPAPDDIRDAFEALFVPEPNSGCWIWIGNIIIRGGYGSFTMRPAGIICERAHRRSWKLYRDPEIDETEHVLHHCDLTCCVNPEHLFIGDQRINMHDMCRKGRQARGIDHGMYVHGDYVGDKVVWTDG